MPLALVDVDDTLAATQSAMLAYLRKRYRADYRFYDIAEDYREGQHQDYQSMVSEFLASPALTLAISPFPGVGLALQRLSVAGFQIHIVSSRKENLHHTTGTWLAKHNLLKFVADIHPRPNRVPGHEFKVRTARRVGVGLAFEDTNSVAQALAANGVLTYLIRKPWNKDTRPHPLIIKSANFAQAVESAIEVV